MSSHFWVARYIEDPFRNEQKNVGVFARVNGVIAARFLGERDDGFLDGRLIRGPFVYPSVYSQWRDFWRKSILSGEIDEVVAATTANFTVVEGGEVTDTGNDDAQDVCAYLFSLLVSGGREAASEAFGWTDDEVKDKSLSLDISETFDQMYLLSDRDHLLAAHPIEREAAVRGEHVTHKPSFSQRNGKLSIFEYIDLGGSKTKLIRERAGWMAYMFADIGVVDPACEAFSIVRPEREGGSGVVEYANAVLGGSSKIVNWSDPSDKGSFLQERKRVAISV